MSPIEKQIIAEKEILDLGVTKLKEVALEALNGEEGWLHSYVRELVWPLSSVIQERFEEEKSRASAGRRTIFYNSIKENFDPFAVAVCILNATIKSAIQERILLTILAGEIGNNIQDYFGKKITKFNKISLGVTLLHSLSVSSPEFFELDKDMSTGTAIYMVQFKDCQSFKTVKKCISLILGRYNPMSVPPKPWSTSKEGGYLSSELSKKSTLVRKRSAEAYEEVYSYISMPDVYDSVNYIQSVPYKINSFIYDNFNKAVKKGIKVENLPACKPLTLYSYPLPKKLTKVNMTDEQKGVLRKWMTVNSHIRKEKQRYQSKMFNIKVIKEVCGRLLDGGDFYFPHNLDYRGRIYPIPVIFNLHSLDYVRAMLLFSEEKALKDENGVKWLAVHGANCYGIDKESYEGRVKWVKDNEMAILFAYKKPMESTFWHKAKDPFQFLAFCKEWAGYCKYGLEYRTGLPIGVDATCSGLQHYSAMLKDPVGAKYVNILPSSKPQDIYQEVADVLVAVMKELTISGSDKDSEMAKSWLSLGINRKTTKRVVMTTVYSLTQYASRQYIEEYIIDTDKDSFTDSFKASLWLAPYMWKAVTEVIRGARVAMDYLKLCTKDLSKVQEGIVWQVPSGFVVYQKCMKKENKGVVCHFGEKKLKLTVYDDSDKISSNKQVNAACPNIIHSLDACHLMMVANRSKEEGLTGFSAIHDCFFTHPSDVDRLQRVIRESFVDVYHDSCFLSEFKSFLEYKYDIALPPVPKDDNFTLDIRDVIKSEYFFC